MARRPVIGITMDYVGDKPRYMLPYAYCTSIERAGGLPFAIPFKTELSLIPEIVGQCDGLLFSGGDDMDPARWGEVRHPKVEPLDPARERFELMLLAEVEKRRMPALGVCLGSQLMNVYRGGTLIQFLPDHQRPNALEHRRLDAPDRRHEVRIEAGSILSQAVGGTDCIANTQHKQAIGKVGRGLRVVATAPDGVIEGIEDPSLPLFLAVQWHPERLYEQKEHLGIFEVLVDAARQT